MARPKTFDREQVLDLAMELFCEKGFEATSIQDLVDRMGIGRASLYDTFGSKRGLVSAALDHYIDQMRRRMLEALSRPGHPRAVIGAFFHAVVEHQRNGSCLVAKSALLNGQEHQQLNECVCGFMDQAETAFQRLLERGRQDGTLASGKDPRTLARFFVNLMQGLTVTGSARTPDGTAGDVVDIAMSVLD